MMPMIANILNGTIRPSQQSRDTGSWTLPVSAPSEAAFALKCVRRNVTDDFRSAVAALTAIGKKASWISDADLKMIASKTGSPIKYMRFSVDRVNRWLASVGEYLTRVGRMDEFGAFYRDDVTYMGGIPSAFILAGDDITVAPWMLGHAILARASALIKPSSVEPLSAFLFVKAASEEGIRYLNLLHLDSSSDEDRASIKTILQSTGQSVVLGEDATVERIYGSLPFLPTHKAIPYWSGRSGVILYPDADLALAARSIVFGATEDRGNRCISTKKVFAPKDLAKELEALLITEADRLKRGSPLEDNTDIGTLDAAARTVAESAAADGEVIYDREMIFARCDDRSRLICDEVPYPAVGLRYYDAEDPVDLANASVSNSPSRRSLVMSVFTRDATTFKGAAARMRSYKVVWNTPTSQLDLGASHQGMHLFLELMRPKEVHS
jgi:acyl-CoA reductase-like NAD-dependent aldehyde dehydrogenase